MGIKIISTGKGIPNLKVSNFDLEKIFDTTDEWIRSRTGIVSRYIAKEETSSSLAIEACKNLLEGININLNEIGLIVCATMTPDTIVPTVAANIKASLGIKECPAFDINVACSGFIYAISVAESMMKNYNIKKAIVVGVDLNSQIIDWKDRGLSVVFGDGAGAILLSNETKDDSGIESTFLNTIDDKENSLTLFNFVDETPFNRVKSSNDRPKLSMLGQKVMKFGVNAIASSINSLLLSKNLKIEDISYIVPHQANHRIIKSAAKNMNIPIEKFYMNIDKYANTSAGSIPIALDELNRKMILKKGDYIILLSFGGGLSFGSILIKW